jgi:twitching motility two-component system response regulator PilH
MTIKNILVVDDSPTERHFLSEVLMGAGYQVSQCDSGEQAVSMSKALLPDLILMDVVMPGLNGFQATRQISKDAATKHIPVIICTTKSQETDKIWAMRQGARDYLVKPVNASDLLEKISRLGA